MTEGVEGVAVLVEAALPGFKGYAAVYRLSPPMTAFERGSEPVNHRYVVISAVVFNGQPETLIFPSHPDGEVKSFMSLPGSTKGTLSHAEALRAAGYSIVEESDGEG